MSHQPAHEPSPCALPPYPFVAEAPQPADMNSSTDLASANPRPRPSAIFEHDQLPAPTPPRLQRQPYRSQQRKLSDATRAPDPSNGYQGPPAMTKKPTSERAFHPINTLNDSTFAPRNNPVHTSKHPKTYGKLGRSIGEQRHGGQQAYLERNPSHLVHGASHTSPAKRRKTEHAPAAPVVTVEIEDSDDERQQPAQAASTPRPGSAISRSRSPHSTDSRQARPGLRPPSESVSEFTSTQKLFTPFRRRIKSHVSDESQNGNGANVPTTSVGKLSRGQSVVSINDEEGQTTTRPRERRESYQSANHVQSQRPTEGTTSRHFPANKMRINESTAETRDREAVGLLSAGIRSHKNLREHRPAERHVLEMKGDPIEGSEDELAEPNTTKSGRRQSSSKNPQHAKAISQRKGATGKHYRLNYIRTYDSVTEGIELSLQFSDRPKIFEIRRADVDGDQTILDELDVNSVNKAITDNVQRVRLTGPANPSHAYYYDLGFEHAHELERFRDEIILPELADSAWITRTEEYMKRMFARPMRNDGRIGTLTVSREVRRDRTPGQQPQSKTPLLSALMDSSCNTLRSVLSDGNDLRKPTVQNQARPIRTTRATAPNFEDTFNDHREVEKFSETTGLGKRWPGHLDFNIQESFLKRRRCTVNFDDLPKLDEEEYLNDSLVNFYLLYLYDQLKVSIDRVYFFNTYFFDTLTKNTKGRDAINYDAVRSWTRRDDVFSYDHIVIPINEKFHWYLAIICNVSNIARKLAVQQPTAELQGSKQADVGSPALGATPDVHSNLSSEQQDDLGAHESPTDKDVSNDEENLFEEERRLSLIDRDNTDESEQQTKEQVNEQTGEDVTAPAPPEVHVEDITSSLAPRPPKQVQKKKTTKPKFVRDPEKPVIMVLDSMGATHSNATRALREWLHVEGLEKRGMDVEIDNKGYYPKSAQIPTQGNIFDCGLYVLGYAKKFFEDPDVFKSRLLKGEMSSETDWPDMDASKMRADIRNLIFRLHDEQREAQKEVHKAKKAAKAGTTLGHAAANDVSHSPVAVDQKSTAVQQPGKVHTEAPAPAPQAAHAEAQPVTSPPKSPGPESIKPSLGAPFVPNVQTGKAKPRLADSAESKSSQPLTVGSSPNATIKVKQSPTRRARSPEVRVPSKSPRTKPPGTRVDRSPRQLQQVTDLSSPVQKRGFYEISDGYLRTPAMESQAESPQQPPELLASSSTVQGRTRSGSHDDPITLDDSQDLDVLRQHSARKPVVPREVVDLERSQEDTTARHAKPPNHSLDRDDSIQDGVGHEWQEGRNMRQAVKASLLSSPNRVHGLRNDVPDAQPNAHNAHAGAPHSPPAVYEIPDTQAMDVDDDGTVIPESPELRRSSPADGVEEMDWQATAAYTGRRTLDGAR
ncbi:hypothetical protein C7974DRAFT_409748 [Boeremia exigua]|uniref:uncharacterized protein n=1 Tax=Boeremia exigua TaxID=749465 RepID=UPI001E8D4970|nr:uncharacterized protein C7974DRAFT_409748 [Boeremia exigua]KAH6638734.1 hypothetical protein C7974DRAFT_409748 [Boeremia exigua]